MADFDNAVFSDEGSEAAHEDALVFELNGYTVGWKASGLALKRASDQGWEAGDVFEMLVDSTGMPDFDEEEVEAMQDMDEEEIREEFGDRWAEAEVSMAEQLEAFSTLVWLGMLHFDANVEREHVLAAVDPAVLEDVPTDLMMNKVWPQLSEFSGDTAGKE